MSMLQAVLLGALQGFTEFLPVSSSGHLVILREVLDLAEIPVLFDVLLHVATLVVVVAVFRHRILAVLVSLWRLLRGRADESDRTNFRLAISVIVASALTAAVGLAINEASWLREPNSVAVMFIITAGLLLVSRRAGGRQDYSQLDWRVTVLAGVGQGLGVAPGISRSGITISASRLGGMQRELAGEYAFILSIPAILGALLLTLGDAGELAAQTTAWAIAGGVVAAMLTGWLALRAVMALLKSDRLFWFAAYLIPLGIIAGIIF